MTGVEILASQEVAVEFAFNWTAFWITIGVCFLFGLALGIVGVVRDGCPPWFIHVAIALFSVGGAIIAGMIGNAAQRPIEYETRYKVTISDEVIMTDFLEKYEIVTTEGKIYTVREVREETK